MITGKEPVPFGSNRPIFITWIAYIYIYIYVYIYVYIYIYASLSLSQYNILVPSTGSGYVLSKFYVRTMFSDLFDLTQLFRIYGLKVFINADLR